MVEVHLEANDQSSGEASVVVQTYPGDPKFGKGIPKREVASAARGLIALRFRLWLPVELIRE